VLRCVAEEALTERARTAEAGARAAEAAKASMLHKAEALQTRVAELELQLRWVGWGVGVGGGGGGVGRVVGGGGGGGQGVWLVHGCVGLRWLVTEGGRRGADASGGECVTLGGCPLQHQRRQAAGGHGAAQGLSGEATAHTHTYTHMLALIHGQ
jgi:hypothetical protein